MELLRLPSLPNPSVSQLLHDKLILVVQADEAERRRLAESLAACGARLEEAADAWGAMRAVALGAQAGRPVDLALIDAVLPGMGGVDCARQLLTGSRPGPRIVLMAGAEAESVRGAMRTLPALVSGPLEKPVSQQALVEACARALGQPAAPVAAPAFAAFPAKPPVPAFVPASPPVRMPAAAPMPAAGGPDPIATIPGIDVRVGRATTLGNEKLYRRLLTMFRKGQRDAVGEFRAARLRGDRDGQVRVAHNLKGIAGSLGMLALNVASGELEEACVREAGESEVQAQLAAVERELVPIIAALDALSLDPP